MGSVAAHLFVVTCRACHVPVATVPRIGGEELAALLAHVRACRPDQAPADHRGVEAILRHFDVRATEGDPA